MISFDELSKLFGVNFSVLMLVYSLEWEETNLALNYFDACRSQR